MKEMHNGYENNKENKLFLTCTLRRLRRILIATIPLWSALFGGVRRSGSVPSPEKAMRDYLEEDLM